MKEPEGMSYDFFQQVIPPTGVELCVAARFTGEDANNLIVSKANAVDIYALHRHSPADDATLPKVFFQSIQIS